MTRQELIEWARKIVEEKDKVAILVFADALDELGDIRSRVVRKHALCCQRGMGIVQNIANQKELVLRREELEEEWDRAYAEDERIDEEREVYIDPDRWECLQ